MKTRNSLIGLIILILCSCTDDSGTTPTSTLTFNGNTYTIADAYVDDYGNEDPLETGIDTHFGYEIGVSDAVHTVIVESPDDQYFGGTDGVSFRLYVSIYRPNNTDIDGTYQFIDDDVATFADIDGELFFTGGEIELDEDNLAPNGDLDGDEFEVVGGTITITGADSDYTITFNIEVADGDNEPGDPIVGVAVGSYTGTFQYLDNTDQ